MMRSTTTPSAYGLNAYAGLAAGTVLIDDDELPMLAAGARAPGRCRIPLVLQDKSFKGVADAFGTVGDLTTLDPLRP